MMVLLVNGRTSRRTAQGGPPLWSAQPRASAARQAQATSRRQGWPRNVTSRSSLPGARLHFATTLWREHIHRAGSRKISLDSGEERAVVEATPVGDGHALSELNDAI